MTGTQDQDRFAELKEIASLREYVKTNLKASKHGKFCCPLCGSGTHRGEQSDGAFVVMPDGMKWICHVCKESGDIFDLAGIVNGCENDKMAQLKAVGAFCGVEIDQMGNQSEKPLERPRIDDRGSQGVSGMFGSDEPVTNEQAIERMAAAQYLEQMRGNVSDPECLSFLSGRGITEDDARRVGIGYDPSRKKVIMPWKGCPWYYVERDITGKAAIRVSNTTFKVGPKPLYNRKAAEDGGVFVIVEGPFDAVSFELCGVPAIALGTNHLSACNMTELLEAIGPNAGRCAALLMLDNDNAGELGTLELSKSLEDAGVACVDLRCMLEVKNDKDPSEWFARDREEFGESIKRAVEDARGNIERIREESFRRSLASLNMRDPADVARGILAFDYCEEPTPTGIVGLDKCLDGGLRSALHIIGAQSSMGKTTLSIQIGDFIAEHGRPVLFVTIEQSAREIVSKSLSRIARQQSGEVITCTEMISRKRRDAWGEIRSKAFEDACRHYEERITPRLYIYEGTTRPTVSAVESAARKIADRCGVSPVVIIDYLQLLAPYSATCTDKQATDENVMQLRIMAKTLGCPIWAVSSLNRASYSGAITLDSFKESGAIEYGADVLIGVQPFQFGEGISEGAKHKAAKEMAYHKSAAERDCELHVLKNRAGSTTRDGIRLSFITAASIFIERTEGRRKPYITR